MSRLGRREEFIILSDDEEEPQPTYSRLRRTVEEDSEGSEDEVSVYSEDGYDSLDDFVVPDEVMMQVDGEEDAELRLAEVLTSYRRSNSQQAITEMEVTFESKYSRDPVFVMMPPGVTLRTPSYRLAEIGKTYYQLYDENKPSWSTMTHNDARQKREAMQNYLHAAYCYHQCTLYDRARMVEVAESKSAGNELLRVYRIILCKPELLHYSGLTKTGILRFK